MNLVKNVKVTVVSGATAAGTTEVDSSILDTAGYDGVMFVAVLGAITANGVDTFKAQENTTNATGGMADIAASSAVFTDSGAGTTGPSALVVDVYKPQQRYVRAALLRSVANTVVDCILAIQYCGIKRPTVQDASVIAQAFVAPTA